MRLLVSIILLLFFQKGFSQYNFSAEYPGGMAILRAYINGSFPPHLKVESNFLMKVNVYTDDEGNVYECEILNSYSYEVDEKIIKLFLKMPQWIPAKENGKSVASTCQIQFNFNPQENILSEDDEINYTAVENNPEFIGGTKEMYKYLATMRTNHFVDLTKDKFRVYVKILIKKTGEVCCVEFLSTDFASKELQHDIEEHILKMPKWSPGYQYNFPKNVYYTFPVKINSLDN